jgi:serine/threonine-protein kinase HipA
VPAYDLCHAYRPGSGWVSQHALSINGKIKEITKADLRVVGKSIRCQRAPEIIEKLNDTVDQWKRFADEVGVRPALQKKITKNLLNLKK